MNPKRLTERERDVLDYLLSIEFPGAPEVRAQAATAQVRERLGPTVMFDVDANLPDAHVPHVVPVECRTRDERPWDVLLFVKDGRLDSVELVTYDVGEARELPSPDELQEPTAAQPG
jgi:hypothetical protein